MKRKKVEKSVTETANSISSSALPVKRHAFDRDEDAPLSSTPSTPAAVSVGSIALVADDDMVPFSQLSLRLCSADGAIEVLDQRKLPDFEDWISCREVDDMFHCIRNMCVRGAPMIGIAASMALARYATDQGESLDVAKLRQAALHLRESRPTAVNLMYCVDKIVSLCDEYEKTDSGLLDLAASVRCSAYQVMFDEEQQCEGMGRLGAALVQPGEGVMTHCNTGSLATAGIGTALGVIRVAHQRLAKQVRFFVGETRPLLQGGRLTTYELTKSGIPFTLLCDSMAASLMRDGSITRVFVGADRIAVNGDTANKIGTYSLAVLARVHGVPFHVVAPSTTVDLDCDSGEKIPIEQRKSEEVRGVCAAVTPLQEDAKKQQQSVSGMISGGIRWAPRDVAVANPAFDVTPVELITSFVFGDVVVTREQLKSEGGGKLNFIFKK